MRLAVWLAGLTTAITVLTGCTSHDAQPVSSLHVDVADGLYVALFDTKPHVPYVFDVGPACTQGGIPATITSVRFQSAIEGGMQVTGWGARDSASVSAAEAANGPGAVPGRLSQYPAYTTHQFVTPARTRTGCPISWCRFSAPRR